MSNMIEADIKQRALVRIPEISTPLLDEYAKTAMDRIKLRLGVDEYPIMLESVAVDVVCALYNRRRHEGLKDETVDTFRVNFVDDVLKEYSPELQRYLAMKEKQENENRGVVRFL